MLQEAVEKGTKVLAPRHHLGDLTEGRGRIARRDRLYEIKKDLLFDDPQHGHHVRYPGLARRERDHLVEDGLGVPHAPLRRLGDGEKRLLGQGYLFGGDDLFELRDDLGARQAGEIEPLTARQDGRQDLIRLCRRKDELHEVRRLLERLQERVEGLGREHVDLVDDVDLALAGEGRELDILAQGPDLVDAPVRGPVDLDHVEAAALGDLRARRARPAGLLGRPLHAIEGLGQDPGAGGLAHPLGPGKKIRLPQPSGAHRVLQGLGDVFLADDLIEILRPPFASKYEVGHYRVSNERLKKEKCVSAVPECSSYH